MRPSLGILAAGLMLAPTGPARAVSIFMPVEGDLFRYAVSSGEKVTLEVIQVRPRSDQILATVRETRTEPGGDPAVSSFDIIRTATSLAIDIPTAGDNARLSPLVYFFAPASTHDSWLAQQGIFVDPTAGTPIRYQVLARVEAIETVAGPAGTFPECRRVTYTSTLPSTAPTDLTVWLHPDIGIVRSYSRTGGATRLTELVGYRKFEKARSSARMR